MMESLQSQCSDQSLSCNLLLNLQALALDSGLGRGSRLVSHPLPRDSRRLFQVSFECFPGAVYA